MAEAIVGGFLGLGGVAVLVVAVLGAVDLFGECWPLHGGICDPWWVRFRRRAWWAGLRERLATFPGAISGFAWCVWLVAVLMALAIADVGWAKGLPLWVAASADFAFWSCRMAWLLVRRRLGDGATAAAAEAERADGGGS